MRRVVFTSIPGAKSIGPIGVHGAVDRMLPHYRAAGRPIPETVVAGAESRDSLRGRGLIVAPGSAQNTPWIRRFAPYSLATASGWMQVRGSRRRRALDRGFVISDHADWQGILNTVEASEGKPRHPLFYIPLSVFYKWFMEFQIMGVYKVTPNDS